MEEKKLNCKNCETSLSVGSLYCHSCGQKVLVERYTVKRLIKEIIHILTNVQQGFLYTLKQMFVAPATVIADYCTGRTKPYYHPFRYAFIWASLSVLVGFYFDIYDSTQENFNDALGLDQDDRQRAYQAKFNEFIKPYINLVYLVIIPFMSYFTWRFFKKKGYNYAEHLIANSFAMGQMAFIGLFTTMLYASNATLLANSMFISVGISALFYGYIYKNLYKVSYLNATFKSLLSLILGYLLLMVVVGLISLVVALIVIFVKRVIL